MWRDDATLVDIADAARRIDRFVRDVEIQTFVDNAEKHWAVVSQLLIIGEAVNRLSEDFQTAHSTIEWAKIAGMRNRLIHGYDKIRWDLVYDTATKDVPALLTYIDPLIPPRS